MNRQPFQTPPQWWSPRLSARSMRLWRPVRRWRGVWEHGLSDVEIRGAEHVHNAVANEHGLLITPNHPTHADPFVLLEASDSLRLPFYFMTAWQVFAMTHRLGRRVLRKHGCFSINREGHDVKAVRQAVRILEQNAHPLIIFPEGEVFHLNDRVMPFRRGAATVALRAAGRSGRPVSCIPCGMKFQYIVDPTPQLLEVANELERRMDWSPCPEMPLARRIQRIIEGMLAQKEMEHFGEVRHGSFQGRSGALRAAVLGRLEDRYGILTPRGTVPERVKLLRLRTIARLECAIDDQSQKLYRKDLEDLFLVMQLFSYPADYLAGRPSIERMAETLDKLEEDVLGVRTARKRGVRRAVVSFGEPIEVGPFDHEPDAARRLTEKLRTRVQMLLDEINQSSDEWVNPIGGATGDHVDASNEILSIPA